MDKRTKEIYEKYGINPKEREIENQKIVEEHYKEIDFDNKNFLKSLFKKGLEENFNHYKHFLQNPRFFYFTDLEYTIGEIVKCLIIEAYTASITLTNHFLERVLKLALIQKESGVQSSQITEWNKIYSISDKYSSKCMSKTIEECKKYNLISETEYEELTNFRQTIRNGFSHYDPKKILKDSEDTIDLIMDFNFEKIKISGLNFKTIPTLQTIFIKKFAQENAEKYFNFAFNLMLSIENHFKIENCNNTKES